MLRHCKIGDSWRRRFLLLTAANCRRFLKTARLGVGTQGMAATKFPLTHILIHKFTNFAGFVLFLRGSIEKSHLYKNGFAIRFMKYELFFM
jgi:hypothetical protein